MIKIILALLIAPLVFGTGNAALAHSSGRAFLLLLPTQNYIIGGALVVALSFVVVGLVPALGFQSIERNRWRLCSLPDWSAKGPSLFASAFLVGLIVAGYVGTPAPLHNPLPQVLWSLWWVGFAFIHALFGNIWAVVNPWQGLYWLLTRLPILSAWRKQPPLRYPDRASYWPAIALFVAFAWYELIYPAPDQPQLSGPTL